MNQKTKRRKTMSKKTQFTGSKNKIRSLSWTSPIYQHGKGKYQNKILEDNIPYVCHKDNVPTNNSVKNLYWGTQKDNMSQASRDGRMVNKLKGKCIKGTEIQRSYIPKLIGMGFTRKEVSEITGLGHQLISDYYIKYKNKYEK